MARLHEKVNDLFGDFVEDWNLPLLGKGLWPAVDAAENENEFLDKA